MKKAERILKLALDKALFFLFVYLSCCFFTFFRP
jgi:hypothetical protein